MHPTVAPRVRFPGLAVVATREWHSYEAQDIWGILGNHAGIAIYRTLTH